MGGRVAGVSVTALGEVDQIGTGDAARVAEDGAHLVGFTLSKGPCDATKCGDWKSLALRVSIDGKARALPKGGPTFVVAADQDAQVELVFSEAGFDQRVSLLTGDPTGENIEVLLRTNRQARGSDPKLMDVTISGTDLIVSRDRLVRFAGAKLYFFEKDVPGQHPQRPDRAYLRPDLTYTQPGSTFCTPSAPCAFVEGDVKFVAKGTSYACDDIFPSDPLTSTLVCVVPANVKTGTLVIEGASQLSSGGIAYTANLERTTFPVSFKR
jgi:hypothetical protein